jgi:uncharacterized membrane protein YkoI
MLKYLLLFTALNIIVFTSCNMDSAPEEEQISSQRAMEIAVDFIGEGTVEDISAFSENGLLIFEVDVKNDAIIYKVQVRADNGNVISMNRFADDNMSISSVEILDTQITESEAQINSDRNNRPSNPAITLEMAIAIAEADIENRGINATYRNNSGMHWERNQWVWEIEFRTQGERMPIIEFYINVDDGNIVKFEWDD